MSRPIRIGISSCLLGQKVRYDGGDKRDQRLIEAFGRLVEWVPVCPEFELGLGVPREPIRLVRTGSRAIRLLGVNSGTDHTAAMRQYAKQRLDALATLDLCGYILKSDSPSCGLRDVPLAAADGTPAPDAREHSSKGLFAAALVQRFPELPVEDEGRLAEPRVREEFLKRVFAYARRKHAVKPRVR